MLVSPTYSESPNHHRRRRRPRASRRWSGVSLSGVAISSWSETLCACNA